METCVRVKPVAHEKAENNKNKSVGFGERTPHKVA